MIRFPPPRLSAHAAEARPPALVVLPRHDDRALLRGAMALAHGQRRRLRAWSLRPAGEGLPTPLRVQLFGLNTSEADRAVRHLVRSSFRGQQTAVRSLDLDAEHGLDSLPGLRGFGDGSPLVVGWVRDGERPPLDALLAVATDHPGPALLWVDTTGPAFEETLAIDAAGDGSDGLQTLRSVADALEASYPQWRLRSGDARRVRAAVADAGRRTLLLVGLPDDGSLAVLESLDSSPDRLVPGPTAFLLPPAGPARRAALEGLYGRSVEGDPAPEPAPTSAAEAAPPPAVQPPVSDDAP